LTGGAAARTHTLQTRQAEVHTLNGTLAMLREDFHHNLALLDDRDAELVRCGPSPRPTSLLHKNS
jgi:hypothetical protein